MTLSVISSISDDAVDCVGRSDEPVDPNYDVWSSATAGGWEEKGFEKNGKGISMKPSLVMLEHRKRGLETESFEKNNFYEIFSSLC